MTRLLDRVRSHAGSLDAISLDARLGLRMLVKHRALTIIGGFAIALAIALGAISFEFISEAVHGQLPVADGGRVVAVVYATDNPDAPDRRILHHFFEWREQIVSIEHLGAFRTTAHNLVTPDAQPEPIALAEVSASAFTVAQTPPLLGRFLLADDERAGAPRVILIGYQVWQSRFGGDPAIVGRTIALDADPHVVVGVMPEGFRFPFNHQYWVPLRVTAAQYGPFEGPAVHVFGRLKSGVSADEAQAELTSIGERAARAEPQRYERMRPTVLRYAQEHADIDQPIIAWMLWMAQLLISMLVMVVGINVAILMYAQTMARAGELSMRTALGASRIRLLTQLFLEALVLSLAGAGLGLGIARATLMELQSRADAAAVLPYWIDLRLSTATIAYGVGLAICAAFIVGVVPALKITGGGFQTGLRQLSLGSKAQLGPTWTFLIVSQVATAVAVLPLALFLVWHVARMEIGSSGFATDRYVVGEITVHDRSRLTAAHTELIPRLEREPDVAAVTFSSALPGDISAVRRIEFDPQSGNTGTLHPDAALGQTGILRVSPGLFDVYDARLLAGRTLEARDADGGTRAVVVDRTFVELYMGTRQVLGQRFRYQRALDDEREEWAAGSSPSPWFEIVGVVDDFPAVPLELDTEPMATVYHPGTPADVYPLMLTLRTRGGLARDLAVRVRAISAEVDPSLQLRNVAPLADAYHRMRSGSRLIAGALALGSASVLLLSAAGIYALLSFTVARRTREIGIRAALGAQPLRLLGNVFGRVLRQLAIGLAIGTLLGVGILSATPLDSQRAMALLVAVALVILIVGLCAAVGPARRSLRLQTTEALRE